MWQLKGIVHNLIGTKKPLLALAVLSPSIAELLTGSTPITTLVTNPPMFAFQFLYLIGFYGGGVLLVREAAARWNKGWATILLLGAAYGIMEEGIAVHTFFQHTGNPVGIMGSYGRLFGVNWVWATGLTLFHSIYSIALPIFMIGLFYPNVREKPWMDRGLTILVMAIYLFLIGFFYAITPNKPDILQFSFFIGMVVGFVAAGYLVPRDLIRSFHGKPRGKSYALALSAAIFFATWVVVDVLATRNLVPPLISAALLIFSSALSLFLILRRVGDTDNELAKLATATGFLTALFFWDILIEFIAVPGILFVSAAFIYLLFRMRKMIRLRSSLHAESAVAA